MKPNTITKKELIEALSKIKGNPNIFVESSYNCFEIKRLIVADDKIIITLGDTYNED